jgi:RNA polymerase sigma-70 factor (ECF subfamily)
LSTADPALTMTPARDSPSSSARSDAISDLIDREAGPLLDYFNRRTLSPDDAADLLGETLVVVWRRERSIPTEPVQARMWLYGVARKVLAGHRRSSRRLRGLTERLGAELLALPAPAVDDTAAEVQDLLALCPTQIRRSSGSCTGTVLVSRKWPASCRCGQGQFAVATVEHARVSVFSWGNHSAISLRDGDRRSGGHADERDRESGRESPTGHSSRSHVPSKRTR